MLALGIGLAGCTDAGNAHPTTTPTATASPAPSPTPSPTPEAPTIPERPAAMSTNDEAGAVAAAQYFAVDLYTYVFASGDLQDWRALSEPSCDFCNGVIANVEEMQAAGEVDSGDPAVVEAAYGSTISAAERYTATLVVQQPASVVRDRDGVVTGERASQRYELHYAIAWQDGWRILAVDANPLEG